MSGDHLQLKRADSFPDSLNEGYLFCPDYVPSIRKTNSQDDLSRFYRYFDLIQKNNGLAFTWKRYLEILQEQLFNFETVVIMAKAMVKNRKNQSKEMESSFSEDSLSDSSSYCTLKGSSSCCSVKDSSSYHTTKTSLSHNVNSNILKKMCLELKDLTKSINSSIDKFSILSKQCISCGKKLSADKEDIHFSESVEKVGDSAAVKATLDSTKAWLAASEMSYTGEITEQNLKNEIKQLSELCIQIMEKPLEV